MIEMSFSTPSEKDAEYLMLSAESGDYHFDPDMFDTGGFQVNADFDSIGDVREALKGCTDPHTMVA